MQGKLKIYNSNATKNHNFQIIFFESCCEKYSTFLLSNMQYLETLAICRN